MSLTFQYRTYLLATVVAGSVLFGGCRKDKVPIVEPIELTKWEKLSGNYKVFDTLGIYLYDMNILHLDAYFANGSHKDSLFFTNLDGNFNFGQQQSYSISIYMNFFQFGHHELLMDNLGNSWKMIEVGNLPYNNFYNDTIKLKFRVTNINYYFSDLVPYCDTTKIQIAVKQH